MASRRDSHILYVWTCTVSRKVFWLFTFYPGQFIVIWQFSLQIREHCTCSLIIVVLPLLRTHTHTHTRSTALFPGLPVWPGTRKVKPIWISLKQDTVSGSGISWAICKSAPHSRQITMPTPHHLPLLRASCVNTNSQSNGNFCKCDNTCRSMSHCDNLGGLSEHVTCHVSVSWALF